MSTLFTRPGVNAGRFALAASALIAATTALANPTTVTNTIREQTASEAAARAAQGRINQIDDRTRSAVAEYRGAIQEAESLKRYNTQLALQLQSQEREMASMLRQIDQLEVTAREIVPFLQRKLDTLEELIKLDAPFLVQERADRLATLKDTMTRADVSIAEKYRRLTEAYQVEMEYGRTLEAYQATLGAEQSGKVVDFLRVGRVALMYQTLDGKETGYWDASARQYVVDNSYSAAVRDGLKVAKKQTAPNLLIVPVLAAQESP
jgi:chromosome segregation ATPase